MNKKIEKYYQNIPTFWNSMSNNYAFNLNYATNNNNWNLVKNLYEKNLVYNEAVNIPKKIHQIWLGSPIPDKYKKLCVTLEIEHNRRFPSNEINRLRGDYPFYLLFSLLD